MKYNGSKCTRKLMNKAVSTTVLCKTWFTDVKKKKKKGYNTEHIKPKISEAINVIICY